ncbi:substrate-binding domain-containing protein [Clostridium sp. Marseille-P3244]|uniref:substrate-binding domain-containing protein n=1 Tax=Clostridium sp. Marseille-P3244 TaxID=1871020 RepID=UPI000931FBAC|nr:substrate-binding domain-containing protein [Clostridium sp. Marseille-P3244]
MDKKFAAGLSLFLCVSMGVCACSSPEEDSVFTGEATEVPAYQANLDAVSPAVYTSIDDLDLEPGTYISVIGKEEGSAYWEQVKAGVQQAADDINEKLGYTGEDKIKVLFNAPSDGEDIDEQVNILDEELARYPDVIAIASIDENASAVQFDLATENDIAIVAFDSGNSYQGIQCTCMTDNAEAAATGAQKLCSAMGESGEVALIVQDSVSGNAADRAEAFREEIESGHPQVTIVETIYMDQLEEAKREAAAEELGVSQEDLEAWTAAAAGEGDASGTEEGTEAGELSEEARTKLEDIASLAESMSDEDAVAYRLEKHPELRGCFGTNADAVMLGTKVLSNMDKTDDDIVLMGFDAGKDQIKALKDGEIDGLVVQNPFGMGYAAVVAAARTVLEIGNEAEVDTGYVWVDQENMEEESVQSMLYE